MNRLVMILLKNLHLIPGAYGKLRRYAKNPDAYPETERWGHIQYMMTQAVKTANVELTVTGVEDLPAEPGFMLYGNHQGLFDVLAIASSCPVPLGIAYKKELTNTPFLKEILACTKSFAMDREDVRQSLTVIQNIINEVRKGRNYVIFPEGTRSKKGNALLDFHGGSFRCAVKAKCPVVPMAFIDSFRVLDEKGCDHIRVQLHYLKPIPYEEYKELKASELAALVKSRIEACIAEHTK